MNYQKYFLLSAVMMTLFWTGPQGVTPLWGQLAPPQGASFGGSVPGSEKVVPGIAWFGVLQDGMQQEDVQDATAKFHWQCGVW